MGKITLSVCKVYKNTGRFRNHRKKTKLHWKHFFLHSEDWKFDTEWVDSFTAGILKLKRRHLRKFLCTECARIFPAYIKNNRMKAICPYCPNDEDE